jgi:Na+/H+ antiporter NhaD/arsenite permease-like protein
MWNDAVPFLSLQRPAGLALFTGLMTAGSNLVSNVPLVLLIGPHLGELGPEKAGWVLLAFTTTVAGNFTLIGSVANIIVVEGAKSRYTLGFFEYLRFGLVSTVLVLAAGVTMIVLLM